MYGIHPVPADGDCMLRSVLLALTHKGEVPQKRVQTKIMKAARQHISKVIRENGYNGAEEPPAFDARSIPVELTVRLNSQPRAWKVPSIELYADLIQMRGTWLGRTEAEILATRLGIDMYIETSHGVELIEQKSGFPRLATIFLHFNGSHYTPYMRRAQDDSTTDDPFKFPRELLTGWPVDERLHETVQRRVQRYKRGEAKYVN